MSEEYNADSIRAQIGNSWSHEVLDKITSAGIPAHHAPEDEAFTLWDVSVDKFLKIEVDTPKREPTIECKVVGSAGSDLKIPAKLFETCTADFVALKYKNKLGETVAKIFNRRSLDIYRKKFDPIKKTVDGYEYYPWPLSYIESFRKSCSLDELVQGLKTEQLHFSKLCS